LKVLFRADASLQIGSGHVMRCLTLAESLRQEGVEVMFACRSHPGHLVGILLEKGFKVYQLPLENLERQGQCTAKLRVTVEDYSDWLGCSQDQDAQATLKAIGKTQFDWLIVDHYGLDEYWERQLRTTTQKLMVIDDLANRTHDCDLLLDQNYFMNATSRYDNLIPPSSIRLLGPKYALLRPEFADARKQLRTRSAKIQRVFVFFGGIDNDNITGLTLEALSDPSLRHLEADVVIGMNNPHKAKIEAQVSQRPRTLLHVQVSNMAALLARADLALGAGGATTWERICVGIPSIVFSLAENQRLTSEELAADGYIDIINTYDGINYELCKEVILRRTTVLNKNENVARKLELVDGNGVYRVMKQLEQSISN